MYWPWRKRAFTQDESFQSNASIENYINHATADGASWDESVTFSNDNSVARTEIDKEETSS